MKPKQTWPTLLALLFMGVILVEAILFRQTDLRVLLIAGVALVAVIYSSLLIENRGKTLLIYLVFIVGLAGFHYISHQSWNTLNPFLLVLPGTWSLVQASRRAQE